MYNEGRVKAGTPFLPFMRCVILDNLFTLCELKFICCKKGKKSTLFPQSCVGKMRKHKEMFGT